MKKNIPCKVFLAGYQKRPDIRPDIRPAGYPVQPLVFISVAEREETGTRKGSYSTHTGIFTVHYTAWGTDALKACFLNIAT